MNHQPHGWGRPRDDVYGAYDANYLQSSGPITHTQSPSVTGTSVLGMKFRDGVVIAADNLASYGALARFSDIKRIKTYNSLCVLGFGGDISDMQYIDRHLSSLQIKENYGSSDAPLDARNVHTYITKVLYQRRSKFDPLWNAILVGGLDSDSKPFLAQTDLLGTRFSAPSLATGYGAMLAQPIMRKIVPDEQSVEKVDRQKAIETIKECMKVLWYRDARSMPEFSIAVITKDGVEIKEDEKVEQQSWAFAEGIKGYGTQTV